MTIRRVETVYGPMFVPDTDTGQWGWLESTGASAEDEQIELICSLLDEREKGQVIDIGANFGCWSLPLSLHSIGVIAFEPQQVIYACLYRTISENTPFLRAGSERSHITAFPIALGAAPGRISVPMLDLDRPANFGGTSLGISHHEQPDAPMHDVDMDTLDAVLARFKPDGRVTFIKADVEGAELGVMQGARATIERWKPIIVAEADHPLTDRFALGNYIESLGYNVEVIRGNNFLGMPL